ncbi:AAA family ATPase [Eubacterium oxidoreducens]|uniref:ATP-dependent protease Clp, ATPase subunit n=1 Tax=Eubacterium oxidoreducens TaxID=1732 RepID=A0A1G6B6X1_EUBOX|nr:AAA family ATPase [Eubacterium oxidoreducens]SDB16400.1 ATP-dependent protease Clp, ATPase subunit [Eubacterium oxidoreducens]
MDNIKNETSYKWWDDRATITTNKPDADFDKELFKTPKSIKNYLDSKMFGCEQYKKRMSVAIFSAIHKKVKTNMLVIGNSGSGKTELARILKEIYPNTVIFDASLVSPKSYRGNTSFSDMFLSLDTTRPAFCFVDEIDKALCRHESELGTLMQNELLKLVEGSELFVGEDKNKKKIDTSLVSFIFMGTFDSVRQERKSSIGFGSDVTLSNKDTPVTKEEIEDSETLSAEFLGRLNGGIITIPPVTESIAMAVLADERYSPISRLEKTYSVSIKLKTTNIEELAQSTAKYGFRAIYSELHEKLCDALYEDSNSVTIDI